MENPKGFEGYGDNCWGLTASYSVNGYSAHMPVKNDLGVITPTRRLIQLPLHAPNIDERVEALLFRLGDKIWGKYGLRCVHLQDNWYPQRYLAIDQLTITPMIENYRTGLLWNLFMGAPEIQEGLKKLGFTLK